MGRVGDSFYGRGFNNFIRPGFDPDEVAKLIAKGRQSKTSIVFISRATKDGKYKGLSENEHLVDVSIKVENGLTFNQKNRFGGKGRMNVFEHN